MQWNAFDALHFYVVAFQLRLDGQNPERLVEGRAVSPGRQGYCTCMTNCARKRHNARACARTVSGVMRVESSGEHVA
jgi:hypothetical protein